MRTGSFRVGQIQHHLMMAWDLVGSMEDFFGGVNSPEKESEQPNVTLQTNKLQVTSLNLITFSPEYMRLWFLHEKLSLMIDPNQRFIG